MAKGTIKPADLELTLYRELARTFRSFDLKTVAEEILKSILENIGADFGSLFIMSDRGWHIDRSFSAGFKHKKAGGERFGLTRKEMANIVRDMIPKLLTLDDENSKSTKTMVSGQKLARFALLPMQLVYEYSGLIIVAAGVENLSKCHLDGSGMRVLENALIDYSFALKNALTVGRINELITKDDLTLAYNRRFFEEYLTEELERARRYNNPLSLIFLDLDGLREVNNRFGHAMGSRTLQEASARTMNAVRTIDKVIRYGGDEFCIILPETDWQGALEVAERVRQRLASSPFLIDETGGIEITGSFGIASYPIHATTKEEMIKKADEAMYRIKSLSKNDIQVAVPIKRFP